MIFKQNHTSLYLMVTSSPWFVFLMSKCFEASKYLHLQCVWMLTDVFFFNVLTLNMWLLVKTERTNTNISIPTLQSKMNKRNRAFIGLIRLMFNQNGCQDLLILY